MPLPLLLGVPGRQRSPSRRAGFALAIRAMSCSDIPFSRIPLNSSDQAKIWIGSQALACATGQNTMLRTNSFYGMSMDVNNTLKCLHNNYSKDIIRNKVRSAKSSFLPYFQVQKQTFCTPVFLVPTHVLILNNV